MIKLNNVSKKLGNFEIKNIDLDINDSEYIVILGPTGAGKTIILELIAGIILPDVGTVNFNETDVTFYPPNERNVGMLYQDYMLFPHYTVRQNIEYGLRVRSKGSSKIIKEKVESICKLFNISHLLERYTTNLSGGEKQRTALARALICEPGIILLDEPFSALDIITKDSLIREVRNVHKTNKATFVHVAHDFEEALLLADKICVVNEGEIVQFGTPEQVFKKPATKFVADFVGSRNIFLGNMEKRKDGNFVSLNGVDIFVSKYEEGKKYIAIRPEDIVLSNEKITSSARNVFKGRVKDVLFKQYVCEVTIDIGIPIVSFITKKSSEELGVESGKDIWVMFKSMEVHVF